METLSDLSQMLETDFLGGSMSILEPRTCRVCNEGIAEGDKALQSVFTGKWICMKCFNGKLKGRGDNVG